MRHDRLPRPDAVSDLSCPSLVFLKDSDRQGHRDVLQFPDDDLERSVAVYSTHSTNYEMLLPGPPPGREDG